MFLPNTLRGKHIRCACKRLLLKLKMTSEDVIFTAVFFIGAALIGVVVMWVMMGEDEDD